MSDSIGVRSIVVLRQERISMISTIKYVLGDVAVSHGKDGLRENIHDRVNQRRSHGLGGTDNHSKQFGTCEDLNSIEKGITGGTLFMSVMMI